ncbi:MAG: CsbD family protein [Casimicrobiaceae bacterium]
MNKDQVKGRVEEAKGKAKEVAGKVVGNKKLEVEGDANQVAGKVQKTYGDAKADAKKTK